MQVNTSTCTQTKTRRHKLTHNMHGDTNASIGVDVLASIKKKGTLNSPNCHTQSTTQRGSPNVKIYLEKFMHIHKLHTTLCASITVCLSRLFIYLLAYLFICVFIIRWTDFLFYLQALFRRESGRTFILWWEQSLIQNRPIPPSIPLSDCLFLSVHQTGSRSLSQPISPTFCHRLSLCVSLSFPLYIFQTHPFLASASLPLSFFFPVSQKCFLLILHTLATLSRLIMKSMRLQLHTIVFRSSSERSHMTTHPSPPDKMCVRHSPVSIPTFCVT